MSPRKPAKRKSRTKPRLRKSRDGSGYDLWYGKRLLKHFAHKALNHLLILQAFEECGWPPAVDSPFPKHDERFGETIGGLNASLKGTGLTFHCNGSDGVSWRYSSRDSSTARVAMAV